MSEDSMIKVLLDQIMDMRSVKKVFMKKRDVKVYDNSWKNISELRTEYDVEIIAKIIHPKEWQRLVALEKEFGQKFPKYKFRYNLIEFDSRINNFNTNTYGKLIYDSDSTFVVD